VDISRAQDAEVGDGTTSVTLLAAELLHQVKSYIEEGVPPQVIIKGFRKAAVMVILYFYLNYQSFSLFFVCISSPRLISQFIPYLYIYIYIFYTGYQQN